MSVITKQTILQALSVIPTPSGEKDIVSAGMVSSIVIKDNKVGFAIEIDRKTMQLELAEQLRKTAENTIRKLPHVKGVTVVLTAASHPGPVSVSSSAIIKQNVPTKGNNSSAKANVPPPPTPRPLEGIKHIIAVGSGKGGVGKSTVAVNLAFTLASLGLKTGIVDADIHGPSIAHMLGVKGKPAVENGRLVPMETYGIRCLSMGLLIDENSPLIWRGPMVSKALQQLLRGAHWGGLDYLILDLPPGTGDIQLSIAQHFVINGAVVVTTPQEVAILDVRKAMQMFRKVGIPIVGVVQNMSYYIEPGSGKASYPFGPGNAKKLTEQFMVPLLAEIPLDPAISVASDRGIPVPIFSPNHIANDAYGTIANAILQSLEKEPLEYQ